MLRAGQRHPAGQGLDDAHRHGGGRDADLGAELDEERRRRARSGDEADQEGQQLVLRHEGPHRRGCAFGPGAQRCVGTAGQRQRPERGRRAAARRRRRPPSATPATKVCTSGPRLLDRRGTSPCVRASAGSSTRSSSRTFVAERVEKMKASIRAKVEHPFRVLKRQFGFTQGSLPRLGEEHGADRHAVRAVEPVDGRGAILDGRREDESSATRDKRVAQRRIGA